MPSVVTIIEVTTPKTFSSLSSNPMMEVVVEGSQMEAVVEHLLKAEEEVAHHRVAVEELRCTDA